MKNKIKLKDNNEFMKNLDKVKKQVGEYIAIRYAKRKYGK